MPQLMPFYWMISTVLVFMFYVVMLKIYGIFVYSNMDVMNINLYNINSLWLW